MRKTHYLFVIVALFCSVLLCFLSNYMKKRKTHTISIVNDQPVESTLTHVSGSGIITTNDNALVDLEIERHGYSPSSEQEREELRTSYLVSRYGANAKLTFHVTDSMGRNVSDADIKVALGASETSTLKKGKTDENGIFVAEGKTDPEVVYTVEKDGYYRTHATDWLSRRKGADVKNGKWQPWNPTIEVTLKEKRNPIPMHTKEAKIFLPKQGESFGYDFEKGDLVAPHGKGEQADVLLMCTFEERGAPFSLDYKTELFITMPQQMGGVIVNAKDTESQFVYRHEAQESGYESQFYLITDRTESKILKNIELPKTDYLTFQSRVVKDENGKIISANYGKMDNMEYGRNVKNPEGAAIFFTYYFNPTPNDLNLEFDGNNLFKR